MSGEVFTAGFASGGNGAMTLVLAVVVLWALSGGVLFELLSSQWVIMLFAAVLGASIVSSGLS